MCFVSLCFIMLRMGKTWTCLHVKENEAIEKKKRMTLTMLLYQKVTPSRWPEFFCLFICSFNIYCMSTICTALNSTLVLTFLHFNLDKLMKIHVSEFTVFQDKRHICNSNETRCSLQFRRHHCDLWNDSFQNRVKLQFYLCISAVSYYGIFWEFSSFKFGSCKGPKLKDSKVFKLQIQTQIYFKGKKNCAMEHQTPHY